MGPLINSLDWANPVFSAIEQSASLSDVYLVSACARPNVNSVPINAALLQSELEVEVTRNPH